MKKEIIEQRSSEWFKQRSGKITSSELYKIMIEERGGKDTIGEGAKTYLLTKVSESFGGQSAPAVGQALDWGTDLEPVAIFHYEKLTQLKVDAAPFIEYNEYYGGSPDGIVNTDGVIEVKCPFSSVNHFKHGMIETEDDFKNVVPNYYYQCLSNMLVSGASWCDFISYDPRVEDDYKMFIFRLHRNESEIKHIKKRIRLSIQYMNELKTFFQTLKLK